MKTKTKTTVASAILLASMALNTASFAEDGSSTRLTCMDYVNEDANSEQDQGVSHFSVVDYTVSKNAFENVTVLPIFGRSRSAAVYNSDEDDLSNLMVQVAFVDPLEVSNHTVTFSRMHLDGNFHFVGALIPNEAGDTLGMYVFGCAEGDLGLEEAESALSKFKSTL